MTDEDAEAGRDRPASPSTGTGEPAGPTGMRRAAAPTRAEAADGLARELDAAPPDSGVESPRVEADRLLCHALGVERSELATTGDEPLTAEEARRLARVTRRRLAGEPLQHIEGTVQFRDLVLLADARAFIPRPETEQLVDRVEAWARGSGDRGVVPVRSGERADPLLGAALDIGTGSGALALSLVQEKIAARAVGLDVSSEALLQAAANRSAAGIPEERVEFRVASRPLWSSVGRDERFDVIVSNPPYVTDEELEELPSQIVDHEPREALAGGEDGLDVVREIVEKAASYLTPGGALFLEIGAGQGEAARQLLRSQGSWSGVELEADLAGRDRFVRAEPA